MLSRLAAAQRQVRQHSSRRPATWAARGQAEACGRRAAPAQARPFGTAEPPAGAGLGADLPARRIERLPLPEATKQSLLGMGLARLSDIQARAFNPILRGRSFVGRSRTGTGKTVAYLLPLLERMRNEKMTAPHSALVLVPTRELCKQVGGTVVTLAATTDVALVYGGPSLASQEQLVRLGPSVVVATPGRCARLAQRGALQTQNVRVLVVDEADAMLGSEYLGRVEKVLAAVAKRELQGVFFSASLPADALAAVGKHFPEHELVDLVDGGGVRGAAAVQTATHHLCKVTRGRAPRTRVLLHLLFSRLSLEPGSRSIVFVDSAAEARELLAHPALDRRARALHSESTPQDRDAVLTAFANREFGILITTDVVARGVDFADVALVLQLHPPRDPRQYVHRAGRTARAGRPGACVTLYDGSEHALVQRVREATGQHFRMEASPGPGDLHAAAVGRLVDELLAVRPEECAPLLGEAGRLLAARGPAALAAALAVLDSRRAGLGRAAQRAPSLLTGRPGRVCLLLHDPELAVAASPGECRRVVASLLRRADEAAVGHLARTAQGWAIDVDHRHATVLMEDLRTGRQRAPFEISVAQRLPRLLRTTSPRSRRAPWASMRKRALRKR